MQTPAVTPWRTIIVSKAEEVLDSKMIFNLTNQQNIPILLTFIHKIYGSLVGNVRSKSWNLELYQIDNVHLGVTDFLN
jgi:hypothetical protein